MRPLLSIGALVALLLCTTIIAGCGGGATSTTPAAPTTSDTLAQIAAAPAPSGVDAATWAQLKAELVRVLASRTASAPPAGEGSAAQLFYYPANAMLSWGYACQGDYDQNGEVNVADLTPLAQHLGEVSDGGPGQPFPPSSLDSVIDGNGDGEINIGDITPLGLNFGARVAGYRVYSSARADAHPGDPDEPNGPGTSWLAAVALDTSTQATARRQLSLQVVPTATLQYYWVRPYDGALDGAASNAVEVVVPPNMPPTAALTPFGNTATMAHIVWDASASHDLEGPVVRYEWDFDGDSVYEYDATAAASESGGTGIDPAKQDYYYYDPGTFSVGVRVTDGGGLTESAVASVTIIQQATWHTTIVDESPFGNTSLDGPIYLLNLHGAPAMFYCKYEAQPDPLTGLSMAICFSRAIDPTAQQFTQSERVAYRSVSNSNDIAFTDDLGRPAVAYSRYVQKNGDNYVWSMCYRHATTADVAAWSSEVSISEYQTFGDGSVVGMPFAMLTSLMALNGKPTVLSSGKPAGIDTSYVYLWQASNDDASSWDLLPSPVLDTVQPWQQFDLIDGMPSALRFVNQKDVLFYRAADTSMLSWSSAVLVDEHEKPGENTILFEAAGNPAVAYLETGADELRFRRALNADGSQWGAPVVVDARANGRQLGGSVGGRPALVYGDRISGDLMFVAANDAEGRRWGKPVDLLMPATLLQAGSDSAQGPLDIGGTCGLSFLTDFETAEGDFTTRLQYVGYS